MEDIKHLGLLLILLGIYFELRGISKILSVFNKVQLVSMEQKKKKK